MERSFKNKAALLLLSMLVIPVMATSLDVLEEQAQREAVSYMEAHGLDIQHGPAIVSGSFEKIVLEASYLKNGKQKIVRFVIDPNWDSEGQLPIRSVKIR